MHTFLGRWSARPNYVPSAAAQAPMRRVPSAKLGAQPRHPTWQRRKPTAHIQQLDHHNSSAYTCGCRRMPRLDRRGLPPRKTGSYEPANQSTTESPYLLPIYYCCVYPPRPIPSQLRDCLTHHVKTNPRSTRLQLSGWSLRPVALVILASA